MLKSIIVNTEEMSAADAATIGEIVWRAVACQCVVITHGDHKGGRFTLTHKAEVAEESPAAPASAPAVQAAAEEVYVCHLNPENKHAVVGAAVAKGSPAQARAVRAMRSFYGGEVAIIQVVSAEWLKEHAAAGWKISTLDRIPRV